jgi:hypothetical protein
MKQTLLGVDAMLSCVVAELAQPSADLSKARADINLARDRILDLAEDIEKAALN